MKDHIRLRIVNDPSRYGLTVQLIKESKDGKRYCAIMNQKLIDWIEIDECSALDPFLSVSSVENHCRLQNFEASYNELKTNKQDHIDNLNHIIDKILKTRE